MANVIIFTGTSRTDPTKTYDKQDQAAAVLTRPLGAYQIANILRNQGYTVQVVDRYHWLIRNRPQDLWFNIISKFVGEDTLWIGWSNTFWEAAPRKAGTLDNSYEQPAAGAIGFTNKLKGQVAMAFAVLKDSGSAQDSAQALALEGELMKLVEQQLGAVARPARIRFVTLLPKTRSGKLLRRALQALCEGRDPGDLTTIDDPSALDQIRQHLGPAPTNE